MSSQSRPHSSIQVFYISEVSSSSASFIFFFWVWSWHLPKDYFIKHSASHSAEKASSSRDASQAQSLGNMATNSNVSFYADVWQHVQKSVWLLKDGRSVHGWLMKEHCFPKTWMGESNCDICSDSRPWVRFCELHWIEWVASYCCYLLFLSFSQVLTSAIVK